MAAKLAHNFSKTRKTDRLRQAHFRTQTNVFQRLPILAPSIQDNDRNVSQVFVRFKAPQ